jgi:nicotinamidase-related amidase
LGRRIGGEGGPAHREDPGGGLEAAQGAQNPEGRLDMNATWIPGAPLEAQEAWGPGTALLTVDLQLSRVPGACPAPMREALLALLGEFRAAGRPIVHALGGKTPPGEDPAWEALDRSFLPRPEASFYGHWLARGRLQRLAEGEVALYKPGWGAFYRTALEGYLRGAGVDTVLVAGCGFPCGPRATLYEASERLFATVLLEDAVSGLYTLARTEVAGLGVALRRNRKAR